MVAIDDFGNPTIVPKLNLETVYEEEAFKEGEERYLNYKNKRKKGK